MQAVITLKKSVKRKVLFEGVFVDPAIKLFHTTIKNLTVLAMKCAIWAIPKRIRITSRDQLDNGELIRQWDAWALAHRTWKLRPGGRAETGYYCFRTLYFTFLSNDAAWLQQATNIYVAYAMERKWIKKKNK